MIKIHQFTFNGFQENTYILSDDTNECVIIDPGCYSNEEQNKLSTYIDNHQLEPVLLLNTHCHIDHVLGNKYVAKKFNIPLAIHEKDLSALNATTEYGHLYGFTIDPSPDPTIFLSEDKDITFGHSFLKVLFTPGHSAGHVVFVSDDYRFIINGDVLFLESIGRTDLPGGDYNTLINSIKTKLFTLDDDYKVYTGHGPATTIGHEKAHNPFLT